MPVSIDCPSCKGHLLIPDALWRQRFVGRVQRMRCKKCRKQVDIDGRGPELGNVAMLERVSSIPPRPTSRLVGSALGSSTTRADALDPGSPRRLSALAPSERPEGAPDGPVSQTHRIDSQRRGGLGHPGQEPNAGRSLPAASRPIMPDPSDPNLWLHLARNVASSEPPPSTSGTVLRRRFTAGRRRWIGISGLTVVAVATACWWVFGAEPGAAPRGAPTTPSSAPPLARGPSERDTPPQPGAESAPPAPSSDETGNADVPAAAAPAPLPTREATALEHAASPDSAPPYDTVKLKQILRWAVRNGQECHKEGRSVGTAELFVTFAPSGKVSQAALVGEPIASAPVSRCILDYARAIFLPPFEGPSFTVSRTITLR